MSHLDHVVRLKERLSTEGVSCPVEQQRLTLEAYARAILRKHFMNFNTLVLGDDETDCIWEQLNRWNRVSPIKGQYIMEVTKSIMNKTRSSLMERGVLPTEEPSIKLEGKEVCLCSLIEFNDLVTYLVKEMRNRDE